MEPHYLSYQNSLLSLSILTSAEPKDFSSNRPTWVPDWDTKRPSYPLPNFKACGVSYSKVNYIGKGQLKTWGVKMATIKSAHRSGLVKDPSPAGIIIDSIRQLSRQALLKLNEGSISQTNIDPGDEQWVMIICGVLLCNNFRDSYDPPMGDRPERHVCKEVIRCILTLQYFSSWPQHLAPHLGFFLALALKTILSRSVLLTTTAQIGIGPALSREGDEVVIMPGCKSPIVVRSTSNTRYQVIGECYFDGMANGEAFLGPLPTHYKLISKLTQLSGGSESWLDFYRDTRSGVDQENDPRFDPTRHRLLTGGNGFEPAQVCQFCPTLHSSCSRGFCPSLVALTFR